MKRCLDCSHVSDQFFQPAVVDAMAIVDEDGEFRDWHDVNFEGPTFQKGTLWCEECQSENLKNIEEEE